MKHAGLPTDRLVVLLCERTFSLETAISQPGISFVEVMLVLALRVLSSRTRWNELWSRLSPDRIRTPRPAGRTSANI
jgi:hypothetical protein